MLAMKKSCSELQGSLLTFLLSTWNNLSHPESRLLLSSAVSGALFPIVLKEYYCVLLFLPGLGRSEESE